MLRFFTVLLLAAAIAGGIAWQLDLLQNIPGFTKKPDAVHVDKTFDPTTTAVQFGGPLYPPQTFVKRLENIARHGADPVVILGNLGAVEKMDASAQLPGQLLFIGQEIPEGAVQVAGIAPFLQGKIQTALVDVGDSKHYKLYSRLNEGDVIDADAMVGLVNPAKAVHAVRAQSVKLGAAEAEEVSASKIHIEAERRLEVAVRLFAQKVIAEQDLSDAKLTAVKTWGEAVAKREAAKVAAIELTREKLLLGQHYITNRLPVRSSIVKTIYKRTGEAVKELEPVVHLYAIDRLTAEGLVEMQFSNRLALGKKVTVDPLRETSPLRVWRSHKKEINAVAVAQTRTESLAASASEDGAVCLWSERFAGPVALFMHSQPVRSLACSPAGSKANFVLAGLANGQIAVWDLDNFKPETQSKPFKILETSHGDAITAIAFSPDGRYFATGSTDGSINMWDTQIPERNFHLYTFDAEHGATSTHNGQVTALHFTPQCTLVTAARDNTLRIWSLHEKGAVLVSEPIAGRSGSIGALGVSRDGSTLLFDQGKTLQFLAPDGRAVATMQNPLGTIPFDTLAEFSPDASLVLTAGGSEGRLQLWKAPTDGKRGFELSQFVTSERSNVTSAAFFDPNKEGDAPFAISGAKDGVVYLWPLPSRADVQNFGIQNVELTQISQNVETKQVRIGVNVPNDGRLIPGQAVTIVID
ncbi:MAG: hypothetical protein WCL32_09900 [Planctomycetota bacterium]